MLRKSLLALVAALTVASCGGSSSGSASGRPIIAVTTNILGDVVRQVIGDLAQVDVVMPPGASPHEFQASAQQIAALREADALVVNGAGFEEGLLDAVAAATKDGVPTFEAISSVDALPLPGAATGDAVDPHFFTDPHRMAVAVTALGEFLVTAVPALPADQVRAHAAAYAATLDSLDADIAAMVATLPAARRKLVTNHEVFSYFADRYGFEVIGAIIPGGGTAAETDAQAISRLAATITSAGVPAIFADTSSPTKLADALAGEAGGVKVVELYSESLGKPGTPGGTYVDLLRTDAQRITDALRG